MAVLTNNRKESEMEFVSNARKLYITTMDRCAHFPKRYTFILGVKMSNLAEEVYDYVKQANDIKPVYCEDVTARKIWFKRALSALDSLVGHISIAAEKFQIGESCMIEWMELTDREYRLINGILKSDQTRLANHLFLKDRS